MQSLKARILRIIATILGFFGISSTFVACYGVPINAIGGRIFFDENNNSSYDEGEEIKGLSVKLEDTSETILTDENGDFYFIVSQNMEEGTLLIEDTDGKENGGKFKIKKIKRSVYDGDLIKMEKDN